MSVTSAPIGNTGQSLDGFAVNANVPAAFRESVVITDPNDPSGVAPVVSTQPLTGYALPVWIQGTPNFSSTVNVTTNVNVTSNLSGTISSFAVNFIPGTTMVNVVSTVPQSITIGTVSTFPLSTTQVFGTVSTFTVNQQAGTSQVFGTVSTQIVSSIPIFVSQSTSPWTVVLPGTTMVNVVSTVPQSITIGTVSSFPLGTTQVNIVSSIPLGGGTQYINGATTSGPTGNIIMFASGNSSQTMQVVNNSSNALPVYLASSIAQQTTGQISSFPIGTTQVNIVSSIALGGGVQYVEGNTTTNPTGNTAMWKSAASTMVSVSTSNPLPVYQISTGPVGPLVGTTMVNIVSTITQTVQGQVSTFPTGVASVTAIPTTGGGLIPFIKIGVTTASVQIKSGAGKVHDIAFTNNATSTRWLKFYNASSAAVGTTAPFMVFGMPGNTTGVQPVAGWIASAMGYGFSTNIFVAATASSATSTDTSSPASGDIVLNVGYI